GGGGLLPPPPPGGREKNPVRVLSGSASVRSELRAVEDFAALRAAERVPHEIADGVADEMHAPVAQGHVDPAGVVAPGGYHPRVGEGGGRGTRRHGRDRPAAGALHDVRQGAVGGEVRGEPRRPAPPREPAVVAVRALNR